MRLNATLGIPVLTMDSSGHRAANAEINSGANQCSQFGTRCDCAPYHADVMRRRQEQWCDNYIHVPYGAWMSAWRDERDGELYFTEADV